MADPISSGDPFIADYYLPDIKSAQDFYPFGSVMPKRNFSLSSYRYGFNGQEKDDELKGSGNSYDFGARIYDPRLGRWLSGDPREEYYPEYSSLTFALNNPVIFSDPNGAWVELTIRKYNKNGKLIKFGWFGLRVARKEINIKIHNAKLYNGTDKFKDMTNEQLARAADLIEQNIEETWT